MAIDTDTLLAPVDADTPCGDNLEYDADFLAMARAATGKAEQQFGSTIIPEEAPDWVQVERLASSLLARTKDLRVMLYLTRAWTQLRGLPGYADGLTLIHQAILRYWDALQPPLEFDGEADPLFRINALADLGDKAALAASVRAAPLLKSRCAMPAPCSTAASKSAPTFPAAAHGCRMSWRNRIAPKARW